MPVMSGIAFMLISVRVAKGWAQEAYQQISSAALASQIASKQFRMSLRPPASNASSIARMSRKEDDYERPDLDDFSLEFQTV